MSKEKENPVVNNEGEGKEKAKKAKATDEIKATKAKSSEKAAASEKPAKAAKAETKEKGLKENYIPRLKTFYKDEVIKKLTDTYKYTTPMAVPKLVKIIINVGMGDAVNDKGLLDPVVDEITLISAQKAVKTYAKKSISNFHLREGMPIGVRVTLRGNRMFDFLDKLNSVALPRVRDFKGLKRSSFDGRGNYTFALREQLVFPEIDYDKVKKIRGMDITVVTTAKSDDEAYSLLKFMGMPIQEK